MGKYKVIALSCSPSRGRNSDKMLDAFLSGVAIVENIDYEKIYLEDIFIDNYRFENRSGPCEDESEFASLVEKIMSAEALVIATPTYNFSVPANLKNFIDRMRFFALDLEKKNLLKQPVGKLSYLKTYFIVSGGTPNWAQKILFFTFPSFWLRGVFLYYGAHVLGSFYSGDAKTFENRKILSKVMNRGMKFATQVIQGKENRIPEKIFFRPPQID